MNPPEKENSDLLKLVDAARLLGVHYKTVWRWVTSGKLPSTRIGGLYFIRRADLEGVVTREQPLEEEAQPGLAAQAPLLKCGYCYRIITGDQMIGEVCEEPGCSEILCTRCHSEGISFCARHIPSREQAIENARMRYQSGDLPVMVEAATGRLREMNFINRIQAHLTSIISITHPASGETINIPDWQAVIEQHDERAEVMRLLNKAVLDANTLAQVPLNTWLEARPAQPKSSKALPVVISIRVLSRLQEMLRCGYDTRPLGSEDLTPWLLTLTSEAQTEPAFRLELLASLTGWNESARHIIQGQESSKGAGYSPAFAHRQALFYLFDLEKGELVYYQQDEQTRRYAELFMPVLPSEELAETIRAVEKTMETYDSLTLKFAAQVLPFKEKQLQQAFSRLAQSGPYTLTEIPNLGPTLIRR